MPLKVLTLGFWKDLGERAFSSAAQQALTVVIAASALTSVAGFPWAVIGVSALGAALVSVITTLIQYLSGLQNLSFYPDLGIRVVKTFLASLLATVAADDLANVLTISWAHAADVAAIAALLALAKGFLARGTTNSASLAVTAPTSVVVADTGQKTLGK